MEIEKAVDILKRLRIATATSNVDGYRILEPLTMGIEALDKQIPKKPKIKKWEPALCPTCEKELSEHLGDDYYKHYYGKTICECGQKLKWDE